MHSSTEKLFFIRYGSELQHCSNKLKDDIFTLVEFLSNPQAIEEELQKLELILKKEAEIRGINILEFISSKDTQGKKILSNVLYQWLKTTNFSHVPVKITKSLTAEEFFNYLTNKSFMKDLGVSEEHGEWTHFLQWYLIYNKNLKLNYTLEQIMQFLGNPTINTNYTLWDIIFDQLGNPSLAGFFCSPENIMQYFKNTSDKFPLLSTLINKRRQKRYEIANPQKENQPKLTIANIEFSFFNNNDIDYNSDISDISSDEESSAYLELLDKDGNFKDINAYFSNF